MPEENKRTAAPICRAQNPEFDVVKRFLYAMPNCAMPKKEFDAQTESKFNGWTGTHYQMAKQMALYYTKDDVCYPRFTTGITSEDILSYMGRWARNYYAPNPFTKDLCKYEEAKPTVLYAYFADCIRRGVTSYQDACDELFGNIQLNNVDKVKLMLNSFTDIYVDPSGNMKFNSWANVDYPSMTPEVDNPLDEESFFKYFSGTITSKQELSKRVQSGNNQIYFGAPGTGKSYEAKKHTSDKLHIRTIFHPDSDYASFIGCYKPVMENGKIVYKYRAQAFINAYINAWQTNEPYYLVIEEINRGNCAQIFGDIFQLLDRTDGESDYDVYPDVDLQQYIKDTFTAAKDENAEKFNNLSIPEEILSGAVMRLPKNLSIIATMNTSDQSLFPMDSAFKRRWEWKYFAIKDEGKGFNIRVGEDGPEYDWWKTIEAINKKILAATKSSDKQIGYWFAKLPEGETVIDAERFVSKVIFYLWNDVFKDYSFGENNPFTRETTFEAFFDAKGNVVNDVVKTFLDRNYPTE